jgi:hypothetical protein
VYDQIKKFLKNFKDDIDEEKEKDENSRGIDLMMAEHFEQPVFVGKMIKRTLKLLKFPFPVNFANLKDL